MTHTKVIEKHFMITRVACRFNGHRNWVKRLLRRRSVLMYICHHVKLFLSILISFVDVFGERRRRWGMALACRIDAPRIVPFLQSFCCWYTARLLVEPWADAIVQDLGMANGWPKFCGFVFILVRICLRPPQPHMTYEVVFCSKIIFWDDVWGGRWSKYQGVWLLSCAWSWSWVEEAAATVTSLLGSW